MTASISPPALPSSVSGDAPDVLVVAHTHWDREWYHGAGRFRQRLVALVDELLDEPATTPDGRVAPFLLDGQAVVLDDYLAVRPERRATLAAALRDGRLEAGPWYVLADNLIPEGETLVRNLLAGRRALAALGAAPPSVCWAPDAFGHPAALPVLAAGFGLDVAIVWRGHGARHHPAGDAAWWHAADGSRVLLHHLPPDGYEFGSRLPWTAEAARERWARLRDELASRARLGVLLVLNGADHHARQERWSEAVAALATAAAPSRVHVVSLGAAAARLVAAARHAALPDVQGERRDSYGYAWTLQGSVATLAAQMRRAARAARRLVRDVEPWLALARLRGLAAPAHGALLAAAWQPYLLCLPHDTLCGCSTDAVARAMDARLDDVEAQARGLRADALDLLVGRDPVAARAARASWRPHLVVRNRAARPRSGVAEVTLDAFVRDVGVGPGSAGGWRPAVEPVRRALPQDGAWRVQPLGTSRVHDRLESPRHYPDDDLVDRTRALVWIPPAHAVPGLGLRTAHLAAEPTPEVGDGPAHPVTVGDGALDNSRVRVRADARGRVTIEWAATGERWDDCLGLEDRSDAGDCYTPSLVGEARTAAWCDGVRATHRGPLRGALELSMRLRVPVALAPAPDGHSRPTRPVRRYVELPLTIELSLDADASHVRVRVRGENRARDHRLRVVVRTPHAGARVLADAAFGAVERAPIAVTDEARAVERPPETAPLHRWVSLDGETHAATLISDGLAEYEARADGALCVTLVRAVGELSRPDLPERPGHAGWPVPTPEAQCPGPLEATLAVAAHGPWSDEVAASVERLAEDVLLPLAGETRRDLLDAPVVAGGIALEGAGLALSAVRPAEADGWVALRALNLTAGVVRGVWQVEAPVAEARLARLDETPGEPLVVERAPGGGARLAFTAPPRAPITVLVRPR